MVESKNKIVGKPNELIKSIWKLDKDKTYTIEIKQYQRSRSLNSNSYAWVLIDRIASLIGITKEEVYRNFIQDVGQFTIVSVDKEYAFTVMQEWANKGLGWIAESLGPNGNKVDIILYFGTSSYTQENMNRFIDYVVERAKELDIEVLPPEELERLKSLWKA